MIHEKLVCPKCEKEKPKIDFIPDFSTGRKNMPIARFARMGRRPYCTDCLRLGKKKTLIKNKEWKHAHPEKELNTRLKTRFGITLKEFRVREKEQNGVCAVCRQSNPVHLWGGRLHVDHNHITGQVRALLCNSCNTVIGLVGEKPETLIALAQYLTKYNTGNHNGRRFTE